MFFFSFLQNFAVLALLDFCPIIRMITQHMYLHLEISQAWRGLGLITTGTYLVDATCAHFVVVCVCFYFFIFLFFISDTDDSEGKI